MLLARLVTKAENSDREIQTTLQINSYQKEDHCIQLRGLNGGWDDSMHISADDPPEDQDGIWGQWVYIMNDRGETIDRYLINPVGGL